MEQHFVSKYKQAYRELFLAVLYNLNRPERLHVSTDHYPSD